MRKHIDAEVRTRDLCIQNRHSNHYANCSRSIVSEVLRRAGKQNIDYAKQHHTPYCWLPAKVMYPAKSTKRFSPSTCSNPIFLLLKNVEKCIYIRNKNLHSLRNCITHCTILSFIFINIIFEITTIVNTVAHATY